MAKLSKTTLDDLKKSGLDRKAVERMFIRDIEPDELADIFKAAYTRIGLAKPKTLPRVHAYEIPYLDLTGNRTGFSRYKLLEEFIGADGKVVRYLQLPKTKSHLYLPPFCNWREIAHDTKQTIYFVEGEKKAASLALLGYPALGLSGVWNWRSEGGELISDFNLFDWNQRKTVIGFDADV